MQTPVVVKIEGLRVKFSDGEVLKKDVNNIWIYQAFLNSQIAPWENRRSYISDNGLLELEFPPI
jgi:hypothetical protein